MPNHAARKQRGKKRKFILLRNARVKQIEERMEQDVTLVTSHEDGGQSAFDDDAAVFFSSPGDDDDRNYTALRTHVRWSVHLSALLIT